MHSRKYLFKEVELRASNPGRIALEFLVQLIGVREYELIDLAVEFWKKLQRRSIE